MADRKVIAKLSKFSSANVHSLKSGTGFTPQGLALVNKNELYVFCSGTNPNHVLRIKNGRVSDLGKKSDFGHANGATYCNKNGLFYVTAYNYKSSKRAKSIYAIDPKNFTIKFTVGLDQTATSVAYDRITNEFYVANTSTIGVYSYSQFSRSGSGKKAKKRISKRFTDNRNHQGLAGFNGIVMAVRSLKNSKTSTAYVDLFDSGTGSYKGSWSWHSGELEDVAVDENLYVHCIKALNRTYYKTNLKFDLKGSKGKNLDKIASTASTVSKTVSETELRNKIVSKAKSYIGNKGNHFWDAYGMTADWCAMFVWTIFKECGMSDIMTKTAIVSAMRDWLKKNGTSRTLKTAKAGDIVIFGGGMHVEIVAGKDSSGRLLTIGGNTGSISYKNSIVSNARYFGQNPTSIFSPKYANTSASSSIVTVAEDKTLEISVDKLYSSDNFKYLQSEQEKDNNESINAVNAQFEKLKQLQSTATTAIPDTVQNINIILSGINLTDTKKPKTKINLEAHGPSLPVALNPIEAPFVQLTIGGYEFGVKSANDTNYITGLDVVRTNGSMNEYTINLVHQVSPGRNPNFIDELLASNSYEKIKIRYGDAMSNVIFEDSSALLIGSDVNFDFTSYCINYTIKATSSVISTATHKLTYASRTDKGSTIIRELLNDASTGLSDIYPKMKNSNYIAQNNLIPDNDKIITVEAVSNMNPLNYLKNVVSTMQSATSDTSTYYLVLGDDYFKIYEVDSMNLSYDASLYEVNINYPDDNQVFSFSCDTNFTWPLAYDFNGNISTYNYMLNHNGLIDTSVSRNPNLLDFTSPQQTDISNNWWKNVTEFPINATLECRGLLSPLLLMTYIKINCLYYGQQRLTSGVYIVIGQQDVLTGSGYKTKLSLLRVAGPQQQLTIDGRVRT